MQEARGVRTFFLFCRGEVVGQGNPKRCVCRRSGGLDDLLPTWMDVNRLGGDRFQSEKTTVFMQVLPIH